MASPERFGVYMSFEQLELLILLMHHPIYCIVVLYCWLNFAIVTLKAHAKDSINYLG